MRATEPDLANTELADIFGVSERMIRVDIKAIKDSLAKEFAGLDPTVIVADLLIMRDDLLTELRKSMKSTTLGTRSRLDHLLAIKSINIDTVKALQDLGVLPKELGHLQTENYDFKAYVIKDAQVVTRRLDMFDDKPSAQLALPAPDQQDREALDEEFLRSSQPPVLVPVSVTTNASKETSDATVSDGDRKPPADENEAGSVSASSST